MPVPIQPSRSKCIETQAEEAAPWLIEGDEDLSAVALALPSCRRCSGRGTIKRAEGWLVCACVYRSVFRQCLKIYNTCQASMSTISTTLFERVGHTQGKCSITATLKRAEYSADFVMTARRALANRPVELAVFEFHCLAGEEWRSAVAHVNGALALDQPLRRGTFFHAVYRVQELVAREILTARPYRLYPAYFAGNYIPASTLALSRTRPRQRRAAE